MPRKIAFQHPDGLRPGPLQRGLPLASKLRATLTMETWLGYPKACRNQSRLPA
jgi:hypothetical protein